MLFSRDDVAAYINRNFEPVWQMVRPVPIVRIDFGNGTVVTRTLHGNVATYVCMSDGQVLDVLPGIYQPDVYIDRLRQFGLLANYVDQNGSKMRDLRLHAYHRGQAEALKNNAALPRFINTAGVTKLGIEGRLFAVLVTPAHAAQTLATGATLGQVKDRLNSPEDMANWKLLAEDTFINESVRRRQIHNMLADGGPYRPGQLTRRLYKEVLHADLDDTYLGLGGQLFANYPFTQEDNPR